jgi:hypothetical protein
MRKRTRPITAFNAIDRDSGFAIRFEQHPKGHWWAITTNAPKLIALGCGNTLGKCRKSVRDGIKIGQDNP